MEPIPRVTARVLPVNPDGEVLVLQDLDPAVPAEDLPEILALAVEAVIG